MIELMDVTKKIDNTFTLGPLSLKIKKGTVTALVGNNGAGKSTLFNIVMELIKLDRGRIVREVEDWKRHVAYVPQTAKMYEGFTIQQLKELLQLTYEKWNEQEFLRLIDLFNLPIDKKLEQFSVGMQKKALLTLALSRPSHLLILDEPLAGVDLVGQEQLKNECVSYMERGEEQTILFATHSADEVKTLADYIVLLKDGKLISQFEKDELISSWRRIWLNVDEERAKKITGIISVEKQGRFTYCLTNNINATEEALLREKIGIENEQQVELSEILAQLLS